MTTTFKSGLCPIEGLTETLPKNILESIVVEAIYKHRYLRDVAELRHAERCAASNCDKAGSATRMAYVRAMIDVHAQQSVLSTLIRILGYVPETPTG